MAKGSDHDKSIFLSLPAFLAIATYQDISNFQELLIFSGFYLFAGLFLSPDIDLKKSLPTKRWYIFKYYWRPYQKVFSHRGTFFNRNFFTHFPIIASFIRLSYLLIVPGALLIFNDFQDWETLGYYLIILYIATELSSLVHLILDITDTKLKEH